MSRPLPQIWSARRQKQWGIEKSDDAWPVAEFHHFIKKTYSPGDQPDLVQAVIDFISMMTDRYARNFFEELVLPKPVG